MNTQAYASMKAGVGVSTHEDSYQAGRCAVEEAVAWSGAPSFLLAFTTDRYNCDRVAAAIKDVVSPHTPFLGFCCAGVLTKEGVVRQGVGVCSVSAKGLIVRTSLQSGLTAQPRAVGSRIGKDLLISGANQGTVVVLPDGFSGNLSEMLRGLYNEMGPKFRFVGGGAGDNLKFFKTYQFTEQGVISDGVAAMLISGAEVGFGLGHGWEPMGDPLVITKVKEKTVLEIDGIPAYTAYCKRVGITPEARFAEVGMRHPLGFPNAEGRFLIRDPIAVHSDQSMDFVTEVPCQAVGYVMSGNPEQLIQTAGAVAEDARRQVREPVCVWLFDCVSRSLVLGDRFAEELNEIRSRVGPDLPLLGALTFGEIGSYQDVPLFHNKTTVICVLGARG